MGTECPLVGIVGGGPAGSVAALCLRKLGHEVVLFERLEFPRYRIGESLLPGTLSILDRLGLSDRIAAAGFTVKRAATFLWGADCAPFTFSFSTPKTHGWTFDHSYQVTRAEFDKILLDAAIERGARVHTGHTVTGVTFGVDGDRVRLDWKSERSDGTVVVDYLIDASGLSGLLGNRHGLRRFDEFYRNLAVWSYFRGGRRYGGGLEGNIFSVTFKEGWIWIIPLKDDTYSVGVVTDSERGGERMQEVGSERFYLECLKSSPFATELLASAKECDKVRVTRDWSYASVQMSMNNAFMCGDAACFIDPLFSQGVHLAAYSATLASAAIDHIAKNPRDNDEVHSWYTRSYLAAYEGYHRFLSSFYAYNNGLDSHFWAKRRIEGASDGRLTDRDWFATMAGNPDRSGEDVVSKVESDASTLAELWSHKSKELDDEFDESELQFRRLQWGVKLLRDRMRMSRMEWTGEAVRLHPSFRVHPTEFRLERVGLLGDGIDRTVGMHDFAESHRKTFDDLRLAPMSFSALTERLTAIEKGGSADQIILRLLEAGLLRGFDKNGDSVRIRPALRFQGVGAEMNL